MAFFKEFLQGAAEAVPQGVESYSKIKTLKQQDETLGLAKLKQAFDQKSTERQLTQKDLDLAQSADKNATDKAKDFISGAEANRALAGIDTSKLTVDGKPIFDDNQQYPREWAQTITQTIINNATKPDPKSGFGGFDKPQVRGDIKALDSLVGTQQYFNQIADKFAELDKKGKVGVVPGTTTKVLNFVSGGAYDPDAASFKKLVDGMLGRARDLAGEKGVLSDFDSKRLEGLMAQVQQSGEVGFDTLNEINGILQRGQERIARRMPGEILEQNPLEPANPLVAETLERKRAEREAGSPGTPVPTASLPPTDVRSSVKAKLAERRRQMGK